ncbi:hypothetical protein ACFQ9V_01645 [Leifsonia sp. NPDC056665]|uniref:hypothetical protein n=1 Tax=Leifsonia sp. NPDC056665 TaxID=3345901 RepID=UPI0036B9AF18
MSTTYQFSHLSETVDLVELARKHDGRIDGHLFEKCHLLGPAVLGMAHDIELDSLQFDPAQFWTVEPGRPYLGQIDLLNSRIDSCTFERVAFAVLPAQYKGVLPGGIPAGYQPSMAGVSVFN